MIIRDDRYALDAALDSAVVRVARGLYDRVMAAWPASLVSAWRDRFAPPGNLPAAGRLRFRAIIVATAAAAYTVIRTILPDYVAPAVPWWLYGTIAAGALTIAVFAEAFAAAWPESLAGRCARFFRS